MEVLGEDYIRTARAKGQSEFRILTRHALRNAAVPIVTVIGIGIALLIGGVVVTESVYQHSRPRPAGRRRGPGARLSGHPGADPVLSFVYVLINLLIDIGYTLLRPADPLLMASALDIAAVARARTPRAPAEPAARR